MKPRTRCSLVLYIGETKSRPRRCRYLGCMGKAKPQWIHYGTDSRRKGISITLKVKGYKCNLCGVESVSRRVERRFIELGQALVELRQPPFVISTYSN